MSPAKATFIIFLAFLIPYVSSERTLVRPDILLVIARFPKQSLVVRSTSYYIMPGDCFVPRNDTRYTILLRVAQSCYTVQECDARGDAICSIAGSIIAFCFYIITESIIDLVCIHFCTYQFVHFAIRFCQNI